MESSAERFQGNRKEIEAMQDLFILSKSEESDKYLACKVNSCFAYDTNITALIKQIEKTVK